MDNFDYRSRFNIKEFENMSITSMKKEWKNVSLLLFYLSCVFLQGFKSVLFFALQNVSCVSAIFSNIYFFKVKNFFI